jgi:hypothetical protein
LDGGPMARVAASVATRQVFIASNVGLRLPNLYSRYWSGARDLNPGPHGPEVWAVSSSGPIFKAFEIDSRHRASYWTRFEQFQGLGLLHELLQKTWVLKAARRPESGRTSSTFQFTLHRCRPRRDLLSWFSRRFRSACARSAILAGDPRRFRPLALQEIPCADSRCLWGPSLT